MDTNSPQPAVAAETWEITFTPPTAKPDKHTRPGTAMLYRSITAGLCGPFTGDEPAADRTDAEALALRYGLMRTGPWATATNGYDYAPLAAVDPTEPPTRPDPKVVAQGGQPSSGI